MTKIHLASILNRGYSRPHRQFVVTTDDGVAIRGVHLGDRGDTLVIFCHGLFSSKNFGRIPSFVESMSEVCDVMAFDFRGHGESAGVCTLGREEIRDLNAVVNYSRQQGYRTVVAIGASMGGATVIRAFGKHGGLDGIVTIGAFADANRLGPLSTRLGLRFFFGTHAGRAVARLSRGANLGSLETMTQPIDFAGCVHVPLLVIHGEWDPLIGLDQGRQLVERAPEPKRLVIIPRGGHVMSLLNRETQRMIADWISSEVLVEDTLVSLRATWD